MEIYEAYWTNYNVLTLIIIALVSMCVLFWFFRRTASPRSRSRSLGIMMLLSIFFWLFIGISFVACFALYETYESQPELGIRTALGLTLLLAVFGALPLSSLLRRYAPRILLRNAKKLSAPGPDLASAFEGVARKVGVSGADLRISKTNSPISFVADLNRPVVVISEGLLSLLDPEEVEAVIAHELAHIKNSDTALKAMVTAYKAALPQDPIIRLLAAAFHREREMVADETAVKATGNPLSLASALLKIQRAFPRSSLRSHRSISILGSDTGLLRRHPSINERIYRLVQLAQTKQ